MQFAISALALAATALAASDSISYEVETVTRNHTTEVTITSCSENKCATTIQAVTHTVVTETVDGVKTVYTTVCPLTESTAATPATVAPVPTTTPTTAAPAAPTTVEAAVESEVDSYVDITTTPTVIVSTGVESTVYAQSTFTSVFNNATEAAPTVSLVNDAAPRNILAGAAGVVGIAAMLL